MFATTIGGSAILVNAYEIEEGMVFAGKTVWSMPERLRSFMTRHYINHVTFTYISVFYWMYILRLFTTRVEKARQYVQQNVMQKDQMD